MSQSQQLQCTAKHFQYLIDEYDTAVRSKGYDVITILDMIPKLSYFPLIPLEALLKSLPPISPRLYSITHNPFTDRARASLLSRLLRYRDIRTNTFKIVDGLRSTYLCERIHKGDEVALFFRESNFHLPSDPSLPIIMIAGGTGIAPFMSFIEERLRYVSENAAKNSNYKKLGTAVLYYGIRNPDEYMFRKKLLIFLSNPEVLSKVVMAFSSPEGKVESKLINEIICDGKINIPDMVCQDVKELSSLIDQGTYIYVCGGAGNFGKAVRNTFN